MKKAIKKKRVIKRVKKPVHYFLTRQQVVQFYNSVRLGKYKGRATELYHIEHMFFSAAAANVIK